MNICADNSVDVCDRYEEWSERVWKNVVTGVKPVYGDPVADKIAFVLRETHTILEEAKALQMEDLNYSEKDQALQDRFAEVSELRNDMVEEHVWKDILKNTPPEFNDPDASRLADILTAQQNGDPTYSIMKHQFILQTCGFAPLQ
jgi:hypothetical protein